MDISEALAELHPNVFNENRQSHEADSLYTEYSSLQEQIDSVEAAHHSDPSSLLGDLSSAVTGAINGNPGAVSLPSVVSNLDLTNHVPFNDSDICK